jgi:hypothetical protein
MISSAAATSQHLVSKTVINIGEEVNDSGEEVLRRQHSPQNNEKMFQRNMMLAREDFQETASVSTFASSESNENLRRFITKIDILPSASDKCWPRKNVSIMSINQDLQMTFDGNLSDDQKLVLNISTDSRESCEKKKIEVELSNENVNKIMLSGQCSPCDDHLDSGTCSDAEANQPPPIPPKGVRMNYMRHHMLSDSFCSDASSASSSDSIQFLQGHLLSPDLIRSIDSLKPVKVEKSAPLPTSLLMDIRSRSMIKDESSSDDDQDHRDYSDLVLCNRDSDGQVTMNFYDHDKSYKFHINEHLTSALDACNLATHDESDENFAGYKDLTSRTSTIRSAKGTIRGVKNRVKNGIATFLQMQQTTVKVSCTATPTDIRTPISRKLRIFCLNSITRSIFLIDFPIDSRKKSFLLCHFSHSKSALSIDGTM